MDGGGAPGNDLRRARNKLIARRLPRFAAVWLPAALAWCVVLHAEGLLDFLRELAAAIGVGSFVALAIAEGAWRAFAVAFEHRANEEASRRELEASRNAYRDLAEQANELIFTADVAGRLMYVNAATARCLGEPESAILGQPLASFLSGHPVNQRLLELLDATEPPVAPVQFEACTIHGLRWFEAEPSPVREASGRPVG